jgi:hypothetical protein
VSDASALKRIFFDTAIYLAMAGQVSDASALKRIFFDTAIYLAMVGSELKECTEHRKSKW